MIKALHLPQAAALPLLNAAAPAAAARLSGLTVRGSANQASVLLGDIQVSVRRQLSPVYGPSVASDDAWHENKSLARLLNMINILLLRSECCTGLPQLHPRH